MSKSAHYANIYWVPLEFELSSKHIVPGPEDNNWTLRGACLDAFWQGLNGQGRVSRLEKE